MFRVIRDIVHFWRFEIQGYLRLFKVFEQDFQDYFNKR